jgi:hypothetical protein
MKLAIIAATTVFVLYVAIAMVYHVRHPRANLYDKFDHLKIAAYAYYLDHKMVSPHPSGLGEDALQLVNDTTSGVTWDPVTNSYTLTVPPRDQWHSLTPCEVPKRRQSFAGPRASWPAFLR